MNKLLAVAGLIGLTGLLASCNVTVTPGPGGGGQSSILSLNAITSYKSSWVLQNDAFDQNGAKLSKGTQIICDNRNTDLDVGVSWTGGLQRIGVQFVGLKTGATSNVRVFGDAYSSTDFSGSGVATITIGKGVAPLKVGSGLSAQAIIVNPVNTVTVKGNTYVQAIGEDRNGDLSNVVQSVTAIPVADCS